MGTKDYVNRRGRVTIEELAEFLETSNAEAEVVARHHGFLVHRNRAGYTFVSTYAFEAKHPLCGRL